MDGYACRSEDLLAGAELTLAGESLAAFTANFYQRFFFRTTVWAFHTGLLILQSTSIQQTLAYSIYPGPGDVWMDPRLSE